jgi:beta-mannosidase
MRFRLPDYCGIYCLLAILLLGSCQHHKTPMVQELHEGWKLVNPLTQQRIPAMIPGNVHMDLLQAGLIPDPFFGTNEDSLQWITNQIWIYETEFEADPGLKNFNNLKLVFEGLDTYAMVYLNNELLIESSNMFRGWEIEAGAIIKKGINSLKIVFHPADSINVLKRSQSYFDLPEERARTRKAPYQFGWDWGPTFPTMGIWKPVKLIGWNNAKIHSFTIHQLSVDSSRAELLLDVELLSDKNGTYRIQLQHSERNYVDRLVKLTQGINRIQIPFEINHPELWWPNGMGDQHLYGFNIKLIEGRALLDQAHFNTGLRNIELITETDSIGESFYFKVNGHAVFMKGANYIPEDNFLNRTSREKTRSLLSDAAAVHMNMIRVWGGGIYPEDYFYEIADSLGLLIWQDFIFACTMYPFDADFLDNVRQEATQQIKRIRKFSSVALWCGNNEVDEGFHNWGWQQSLGWTEQQADEIWEGYQKLFDEMLPELVNEFDVARPWWPSSPSTGWGRPESLLQGDIHYWGVWWGEEPFEKYEEKVGRFHSEYGFQAMPHLATIVAFTRPEDRFIGSDVMEAHQKHPRGTRLIDDYMQRDFPVPDNFEDYIYVSQLVQAHGIVKAIEAHRRAMPVCMGTLYWQLNDCWPVTSWSSIDYYGRWKALHYNLKYAFTPLKLIVETTNDSLKVYLINETGHSISARLGIDVKGLNGQVMHAFSEPVNMDHHGIKLLETKSVNELLQNVDPKNSLLYLSLYNGNQVLTDEVYFFVRPKDLMLSVIKPDYKTVITDEYIDLQLYTPVLIKSVMLSSNDTEGFFADNFFDLLPWKPIVVRFTPSGKISPDQIHFEMKSLNQIIGK